MSATLAAREWLADAAAPGLGVRGASLVRFDSILEARGRLTFAESGRGLPFLPRRFFVISEVPREDIRGEHAHRELHQLLVCLRGSVTVDVDDGRARASVVLDSAQAGLHLAPMVWASQHHFSATAILLVLASAQYEAQDYIREYAQFVRQVRP